MCAKNSHISRWTTACFFLFLYLAHTLALAADSPALPPSSQSTSVAQDLFKPAIFCSRMYVYKNQTYSMDSGRKQDGEGLRNIFKKDVKATQMLNEYQLQNKQIARWPAYFGSLGILTFVGGSLYANSLESKIDQRNLRYASILTGALITLGSYYYGQYSLKQNEKLLHKAIHQYNDAVPALERIQVELVPLTSNNGIKGAALRAEVLF